MLPKRKGGNMVTENTSKMQVNWRISSENIAKCRQEAKRLGLGSVPTVVNYILTQYFNKLKGE